MRVIHVLRKPLAGSVAANVLGHGCGALNIDSCRVAHANASDLATHEAMVRAIKGRGGSMDNSWKNSSDLSGANDVSSAGRWPANLILEHLPGCPVADLDGHGDSGGASRFFKQVGGSGSDQDA